MYGLFTRMYGPCGPYSSVGKYKYPSPPTAAEMSGTDGRDGRRREMDRRTKSAAGAGGRDGQAGGDISATIYHVGNLFLRLAIIPKV